MFIPPPPQFWIFSFKYIQTFVLTVNYLDIQVQVASTY